MSNTNNSGRVAIVTGAGQGIGLGIAQKLLRQGYSVALFDLNQAALDSAITDAGADADRLMGEVSRLLAPGGCFLASFDYWPDKIPTDGIRIFDMSWLIFSREDVDAMVARAAAHGLVPEGPLAFEGGERTISFAERDYTFAWIAFRKPKG